MLGTVGAHASPTVLLLPPPPPLSRSLLQEYTANAALNVSVDSLDGARLIVVSGDMMVADARVQPTNTETVRCAGSGICVEHFGVVCELCASSGNGVGIRSESFGVVFVQSTSGWWW